MWEVTGTEAQLHANGNAEESSVLCVGATIVFTLRRMPKGFDKTARDLFFVSFYLTY